MNMKKYGEWICSDPDVCQYGRKLDELCYEFYQVVTVIDDVCSVVHGKVYLDQMDYKSTRFQREYLAPYSYGNIELLKQEYREAWARIAAECVFETDFMDSDVARGSKDFCQGYITAKVEE